MNLTDKVMNRLALPFLMFAGVILVMIIVLSVRNQDTENNGYIRVINCIISIPATSRTQADIERCYQTVENQVGVKLQRYDTSAYRN